MFNITHYTKAIAVVVLMSGFACSCRKNMEPVYAWEETAGGLQPDSGEVMFTMTESLSPVTKGMSFTDNVRDKSGMCVASMETEVVPMEFGDMDTKTASVTSLSSFYVSAVTGSAGSESSAWTSTTFSGSGSYTGGRYWASSNPEWKFYASNRPLNYAGGGTYITASNDLDVVVAYKTDATYKSTNSLSFSHIFGQIGSVTVQADEGFKASDITNISITLSPKTSGTYNIRTGAWSGITTGSATTIANSTPGTKSNALMLIPGTYTVSCSWTCKGKDFEGSGDIVFNAGEMKNINMSLGGERDLTFECVESGKITWKYTLSYNIGDGHTIQYSKDSGETWNDLTASYYGRSISVNAGDVILIKGTSNTYQNHSFYFSNKVYVYGDVCSLIGEGLSMAQSCFRGLFKNCVNLYTYEDKRISLSATTLNTQCYEEMFSGCTSLTTAPVVLPATTLANYCYQNMFYGCTSLTKAPELPATTLAEYCYQYMFRNCTSLTVAPALPATTLSSYCYGSMFQGCTSLTTAPELPATSLSNYCYMAMFSDCTSLITAPEILPATRLQRYCYNGMFRNCTSLTTAPVLPATTLIQYCYGGMFSSCTSLNYIKALFTTDPSSDSYANSWVYGVASTGTFVKSSAATWNVTGNNGVPTGWTVMTE